MPSQWRCHLNVACPCCVGLQARETALDLFYVKCATAVCWVGNYSGINKLSCLLYALPLTARQGSFAASAPDVCLHIGITLAAMGRCFQGEAQHTILQAA